jgi:hypothetical protein
MAKGRRRASRIAIAAALFSHFRAKYCAAAAKMVKWPYCE